MHSLSRRLLISVSVPLALFFGVMMLVLDTSFRTLSERSLQELLDSQMVSLIAAADPQPDGSYAPTPQELDPRLRRKLDPQEALRPIETLRGRGYRFALPRDSGS